MVAKRKKKEAAPSGPNNKRDPVAVSNASSSLPDLFERLVVGNRGVTTTAAAAAAAASNHHHHHHHPAVGGSQLLVTTVWPALVDSHKRKHQQEEHASSSSSSSLSFDQLSQLAAALLSLEYAEGGVHEKALEFVRLNDDAVNVWEAWCASVFEKNHPTTTTTTVVGIHCFTICWTCLSQLPVQDPQYQKLFGAVQKHTKDLYKWMPDRYREYYCKQHDLPFLPNTTTHNNDEQEQQQKSFVVSMIQHVLHLMEGETLQIHTSGNNNKLKRTLNNAEDDQNKMKGNLDDEGVFDDTNEAKRKRSGSDDLDDEANVDAVDGDYEDDKVEAFYGIKERSGKEPNTNDETKEDQEMTKMQKEQDEAWKLIHRALELLCDLLSSASVREQLIPYLFSIHWTVRCREAVGSSSFSRASPHMLLTQQLLERVTKWINRFPVNASNSNGATIVSSSVEWRSVYHRRAAIFQKMCQSEQLNDIIYAGVGLLCSPPVNGTSYLRQALSGLSDQQFTEIMHRMRLVDAHSGSRPETYSRNFLLEVLEEYLVVPADPLEELQFFPLYPTERVLWDFSRIPPSHANLLSSNVWSLPKLHTRFLSFADYLWRNFELVRLESAYEIRSDLTDVIRRVRPVVRQALLEDGEDQYKTDDAGTVLTTEFSGWARMALEMQGNVQINRVNKPLLGEKFPSQVIAELAVDLSPCGESIRREWDELGEHDNLFLVGIDARQMSGQPAPLLHDYHMNQVGAPRSKGSTERHVLDEDDRTFPQRFGVTLVRGCMILQVRDEAGTVLSDPSNKEGPSGTKRIFRVALDPTQFLADQKSPSGTDIYNSLNLVVRRHGKANNFRSVLETIRGLMAGMGSINRVIPPWLQSVLLGQGNADDATFQSDSVKAYARATVGVANPDAFLDYGDTFLDEEHLRASFSNLTSDFVFEAAQKDASSESDNPRCNYRVRMIEKDGDKLVVEAQSYDFPKGICGNPVRFTPLQVSAIRAGLSPGLSLVVGPPGTGKTDVAVQIIASLYHSFPTQRTIVITHSNAALNDIFQKVMARGDVEERYLVRLGAGERDLESESTHDFTKIGRVAYSLSRRGVLLEEVQLLSESLGISGRAERGADGSPSYTCETADYFNHHQVKKRIRTYEREVKKVFHSSPIDDGADVTSLFPFAAYFKVQGKVSYGEARRLFDQLQEIFSELAEYRPLELLRTQRQRSDYLIMKQARVVAMTCTHAAIARSHLIKLGFEYDNIVVEEAGQMLEIESFIPMLLQRGEAGTSSTRLKRVSFMGDHNQLPPVIQNMTFAQYSNLDQSLFARLIRMGVPYIQLDKQGRARPEIASLYSWRYNALGNLDNVLSSSDYSLVNPGFAHTFQLINVEDFKGKGEWSPTPYFFQNVGEAEYAVALFQFMVLIGYSPQNISILTTYNGQRALIKDILSRRCGEGTPLAGVLPRAVSTVDQYQGQQNDIVLLSLVRTESVGHLKDVRRLVVAVSRARLGMYVLCRQELFGNCYELKETFDQFAERPNKLQLVMPENYPTERKVSDEIPKDTIYEVDDVGHMGSIVHQMQEDLMKNQA